MKTRISLLIAAIMVVNTVSTAVYGFTNPLKNYNLYDDVTGGGNLGSGDGTRERAMDEFYSNSLRPGSKDAKPAAKSAKSSKAPSSSLDYDNTESDSFNVDVPKTRNQTLRDSSRNVYADPETTPGWAEGPSFYPSPSFNSIVAKYKKSDFAGCLQECISYVRLHPNDTLGFYYLAMCYTKVSDMDNAVKAYEKVIALNDNPMIVKYATNGRNCIMGNDNEKCYPNVNEPELVYPYANIPAVDLTPVDPETLVNRNFAVLKEKLSPIIPEEETKGKNGKKDDKNKLELPFGTQDAKLDEFINAPYGNGLSPELNKEYKQLQLKKIQSTINTGKDSNEKKLRDLKDIKNFDNQKTDSETIKLAYEIPQKELEAIEKDPEFIKTKQEYEQLSRMLGNDSSKQEDIMTDLMYMNEKDAKNLSPEAIQTMMMRSMMGDLSL